VMLPVPVELLDQLMAPIDVCRFGFHDVDGTHE